jgi:choline dehydrogenase-like flavoprotein
LRSRTVGHEDGVGNRWGMVGRGLCMKNSMYVLGTIDGVRDPGLGPFSTVSLCDHYVDPAVPTGVGGLIYQAQADVAPPPSSGATICLEAIIGDHPSRANRILLDDRCDEHGIPGIVIDYTTDPRDRARVAYLVERCRDLLRAGGAREIRTARSYFEIGSAHLHGTCRAGGDPRRSVVDSAGRVHEVDNLYIADGSFMPYPGGLNPTLTIQAHALRVATFIEHARSR